MPVRDSPHGICGPALQGCQVDRDVSPPALPRIFSWLYYHIDASATGFIDTCTKYGNCGNYVYQSPSPGRSLQGLLTQVCRGKPGARPLLPGTAPLPSANARLPASHPSGHDPRHPPDTGCCNRQRLRLNKGRYAAFIATDSMQALINLIIAKFLL